MFSSLPIAIAGASALLAAYVAISMAGFFRVARFRLHRLFFFIALSGSLYCLADATSALVLPASLHLAIGALKALVAGANVALWIGYAGEDLGPLRRGWQRAAEACAMGAAALSTLPAIGNTGRICLAILLAVPLLRYARASIRGSPQAGVHLGALSLLLLSGSSGMVQIAPIAQTSPFLDAGLSLCICLIGIAFTRRWASDLRSLDDVSTRLEAKVTARTQALERAWNALSRADRISAVGRLAGGMAHEINNPGAALIANIEYLLGAGVREGKLPPDAVQTLEESLAAARRISNTVRQLLLVSRAAGGDRGDATFNVAFVAQQAVSTVEQAQGKRVAIRASVPQNIVARGRGLLLEQALVHLLTNAVLSVAQERPDGEVRVTAECEDGVLVLQVIDNGVGMDDAVTQRLFEPFFTTRSPGEGAGLGLAVSLGLLQALGGEVRVESTPGKGTTMTLVLEASLDPAAPAQAAPAGAKSTQAA